MNEKIAMRLARWAIQRMNRVGGYLKIDTKQIDSDESLSAHIVRENFDLKGCLKYATINIKQVNEAVEVAIRYAMIQNNTMIRIGFNHV